MTNGPVAALLFASFAVLLALGVPIALALGASALLTIVCFDPDHLRVVPQTLLAATQVWDLLAIPLFVLAGNIMARSAMARRLIDLAECFTGPLPGGVGQALILASIFLAGISGSGPADVAVLGTLAVGPMVKRGYPQGTAAALAAICGGIGIVVPPSIALIIYGIVAGASIPKLFLAGVIPGLFLGGVLMVTLALKTRHRIARAPFVGWRQTGACFIRAFWGLLFPLIILGGIYGSIFTPTESAAVAVLYAALVSRLVYRDLDWAGLYRALVDSVSVTAVVMLIVACARLFSRVLDDQFIADDLARMLTDATQNRLLLLLLVNAALLIAGCFMDAISIFYIFVPIVAPVLHAAGVDLVHLGVIMTVNLAIGQVTPPVGVNLYVAASVTGCDIRRISRETLPFMIAGILALIVITYCPWLSLALPSLMHP
ncbi:MAG: TRAP transporter large permease [Phycisphaerae bacterium]|nr:TRAP transporter large permease [Phycisphaerae bacterium]